MGLLVQSDIEGALVDLDLKLHSYSTRPSYLDQRFCLEGLERIHPAQISFPTVINQTFRKLQQGKDTEAIIFLYSLLQST